MDAHPVWRVAEPDVDQISRLLTRAFADDPQFVYGMPTRADREQRLSPFFAVGLRHCLAHGTVWAAGLRPGEPAGVALVLPSPEGDLTPETAVASGYDPTDSVLAGIVERLLAVEAPADDVLATAYPEPHVYLYVLAVDPAAQGQGLGRALVRAVVADAQAADRRVCLFTTAPTNAPFYRGCGLAEVGSGVSIGDVGWWVFGTL